MNVIDLNADLGEADTLEGQKAEADILRYISSANIACGGHAGDEHTMRATIRAAKANGVVIGAHPSYPDRENFGRKSMVLDSKEKTKTLLESIVAQVTLLSKIATEEGMTISYIKPHGALYNDAVKSWVHADTILGAMINLKGNHILLGGPNSLMEEAASAYGFRFVAEGFIDRRYTDDGHLQNRSIEGAVIADQGMRMNQARSLVISHSVKTAEGNILSIKAESLCLHGDSAGAVETARQARAAIEAAGITIKAFAHGH